MQTGRVVDRKRGGVALSSAGMKVGETYTIRMSIKPRKGKGK